MRVRVLGAQGWEDEEDELDLCESGLFLKTPFSMDFLDSFEALFAMFITLCVASCLYVNRGLLADINQITCAQPQQVAGGLAGRHADAERATPHQSVEAEPRPAVAGYHQVE